MAAKFDISFAPPNGTEVSVAEAESFNTAVLAAELAGLRNPGKYIVRDRTTGQANTLNFEGWTNASLNRGNSSLYHLWFHNKS